MLNYVYSNTTLSGHQSVFCSAHNPSNVYNSPHNAMKGPYTKTPFTSPRDPLLSSDNESTPLLSYCYR